MITIDQLEVLLRSIPPYFLFAGLALYLFAWIEKKPKIGIYAEIIFVIAGITALIVLLSGMIPSPLADGLVIEHVQSVIKMLVLIVICGALSLASLIVRMVRKAQFNALALIIFGTALFLFFSSTRLAKIKFELNVPAKTELNE